MINYIYETHKLQNPLLPFIFHRKHALYCTTAFPHWHENMEILHCLKGEGFVKCGPEITYLSSGDIYVADADSPHAIGSDSGIEYRCLIIGSSFCSANGIPISSLAFQKRVHDPELSRLFESIREAFDCLDAQDFRTVLEIRHRILGLLKALCNNYIDNTDKQSPSPTNEHVKKALTYIRTHLSSRITLEQIADHIGISKYHLSHIFKDFTGKSIVETINHFRCQEAKQLIEKGTSVSAAAALCGFDNLSYFTHTFKRIFQDPPSSFYNAVKSNSTP